MAGEIEKMTADCWQSLLEERTDLPQNLVWQDINGDGNLDTETEIFQPSLWKELGYGLLWTDSYTLADIKVRERIRDLIPEASFVCPNQRPRLDRKVAELKYSETPPTPLAIKSPRLLMIVHAEEKPGWDEKRSAKMGIDRQIQKAKKEETPILLLSNTAAYSYLNKDFKPDYQVFSVMGEHAVSFQGDAVILVGGSLNACWSHALHDLVRLSAGNALQVEVPMEATYIVNPFTQFGEIHQQPPSFMYLFEDLHYWTGRFEDFLYTKGWDDSFENRWSRLKTFARMTQMHLPEPWHVEIIFQEQNGPSHRWQVPFEGPDEKRVTLKFVQG